MVGLFGLGILLAVCAEILYPTVWTLLAMCAGGNLGNVRGFLGNDIDMRKYCGYFMLSRSIILWLMQT